MSEGCVIVSQHYKALPVGIRLIKAAGMPRKIIWACLLELHLKRIIFGLERLDKIEPLGAIRKE